MTLWSVSKTHKALDRCQALIVALRNQGPEVARRAASPGPARDGYGSGVGDGVGVAGGGPADPTAAAAAADGRLPVDEVADLWATASASLSATLAHLEAASRATSRAMELGEATRGRVAGTEACQVCLVEAASRRGMGQACYASWQRAGRPELTAWRDDDKRDRIRWDGIDPARLEGGAVGRRRTAG